MPTSSLNVFFSRTLWQTREENLFYAKRLWFRLLKVLVMTVRSPFSREIPTHAMALSFQIIFSLIPLLALIFAVAKGFGIQEKIEPLLLQQALGGEIAQDLIPQIVEYVTNTNVAALGYTGLVFILYTAISLISCIESSFNRIWLIKKQRTIFRKFSDYFSVLLLGPILLFLSLGLSTSLSSNTITQKLLEIGLLAGAMKLFIFSLPWLTSILVLTFLFLFIPNTRVKFFPAFIGGVISGSAWHLSQVGLIHFQVGVSRYNAIYGTFASVPIFMFWVYISWIIVLTGSIIAFSCQNVSNHHPLNFDKKIQFGVAEKIAFLVLQSVCRHFENKDRLTSEEISLELGLPRKMVQATLSNLNEIGYLIKTVDKEKSFLPAMPVNQMKIADFFSNIKKINGRDFPIGDDEAERKINELMAEFDQAMRDRFGEKTVLKV